jgi:hypothetical protein
MAKNPDPLKLKKPASPGHGGPREGAGRPKSKATQRSKEVAERLAEGKRIVVEAGKDLPKDATPLDVMLLAMNEAYKTGGAIAAHPYARDAAPYLHARIAQMELSTGKKGPLVLQFSWAEEPKQIPEA